MRTDGINIRLGLTLGAGNTAPAADRPYMPWLNNIIAAVDQPMSPQFSRSMWCTSGLMSVQSTPAASMSGRRGPCSQPATAFIASRRWRS